MNKKLANMNGFSLVELLLICVVFSVIILAGTWTYEHHKSNSSNVGAQNQNSTTNGAYTISNFPSAGWKVFTNGHVSFQYPSGWKVNDQSGIYGGGGYIQNVSVESPDEAPPALLKQDKGAVSVQIGFDINTFTNSLNQEAISSPNDQNRLCQSNNGSVLMDGIPICKVKSIINLSMTSDSKARLLLVGDESNPFYVSDDSGAYVGASNFYDGIYVNNMAYQIHSNIQYTASAASVSCAGEGPDECAYSNSVASEPQTLLATKDIDSYESTITFKEYLASLNSVSF